MSFTFHATSLEDTDRLGAALAELLPPSTTIAFNGTLGSGKTRLVQAVAVALGVPSDDVNSPTFVLCQHYHGKRTIHHFDAYRLNDDDEFLELGPEEYFASDGLTFIEWADRVVDCLPREYVDVTIEVTGEATRDFRVRSVGDRHVAAITAIAAKLGLA